MLNRFRYVNLAQVKGHLKNAPLNIFTEGIINCAPVMLRPKIKPKFQI